MAIVSELKEGTRVMSADGEGVVKTIDGETVYIALKKEVDGKSEVFGRFDASELRVIPE